MLHAPPSGASPVEASGNAWYSDGTTAQTGPPGTTVKAYATGLFPNVAYRLVTGRNGGNPNQPCRTDLVPANTAVRFATTGGFVGTTTGTVNRLPGTYQLCFAQTDPVTGTRSV